jgi:hypothetical protein
VQLLGRNEIVGRSIRDVLQTPWVDLGQGLRVCQLVVKLDNDLAFSLDDVDDWEAQQPLPCIDLSDRERAIATYSVQEDFGQGERIEEVLCSDRILGVELLLSSGRILAWTDAFTPRSFGATLINLSDDIFAPDDFKSYWGHRPLAYRRLDGDS